MKTLLVITPQPTLATAIGSVLAPSSYRIIQQEDLREDQLLLIPASIDACIVDAELTTIEPIRLIERLRRSLPNCPLILYTGASQWEWEEDAYLMGVNHVLNKPVRARLLNALLERLLAKPSQPPERQDARSYAEAKPQSQGEASLTPPRMLELMRNCSSILTHSLCAESLLKEFLLLLREIIGVNRAAIFLRQAPGSLCETPAPESAGRLRSACAIGLPPGLLEHFELSLEGGIGGCVLRSGRILRCHSREADNDPQMKKEFELLSAQVAIPILDRESFLGIAVFDGRVTGEPLSNEELALVFHLLEQLGMAIKNIWLHDQISANHDMLGDILREFSSACVVVGRDLSILHANGMARKWFPRPGRRPELFEFNNLPQPLASKVFEVLKTGKSISPFKFMLAEKSDKVFQITITPFQKKSAGVPNAALLIVEDFSHMERIGQLEIEAANLRIVKQMADRLAHEIGNAMVPISTYQQLLQEKAGDDESQKPLVGAMRDGIKRVTRLVTQMRFLANDDFDTTEYVPVKKLIEDAFAEARQNHPPGDALLHFESGVEPITLTGDRVGLQHAFAEILLNALQASTASSCQINVRSHSNIDSNGMPWAHIDVHDTGGGFSPESAKKGLHPFFTTRNVGLGLGLAVTHKIIETHRGKVEIQSPQAGQRGMVRVSLPLPFPSVNGNGNGNGFAKSVN